MLRFIGARACALHGGSLCLNVHSSASPAVRTQAALLHETKGVRAAGQRVLYLCLKAFVPLPSTLSSYLGLAPKPPRKVDKYRYRSSAVQNITGYLLPGSMTLLIGPTGGDPPDLKSVHV